MLCIWLSSKGKWDNLMSGFLHKPRDREDDQSTYAGSVILGNLHNEFAKDLAAASDDFNFLNSNVDD